MRPGAVLDTLSDLTELPDVGIIGSGSALLSSRADFEAFGRRFQARKPAASTLNGYRHTKLDASSMLPLPM